MRTVVSTHEVPHLWAHRKQNYARNHGTLYFEGDTIYSYGGHFPIARHVEYKGRKAVLLTTRTYSNTTSGHVSAVRSAIPDGTLILYVHNPGKYNGDRKSRRDEHIANVAAAGKAVAASRRGRSREIKMEAYAHAVHRANAYFEFYGYTRRYDPGIAAEELAERGKAEAERENRRNAEKIRKREQRFRSGEGDYIRGTEYQLLRVDGDNVITSLGVSVPLAHVRKALPLVLRVIDSKGTYERNGHTIHLGHYTIDRIDSRGTLTAGCHRIKKGEIKRLADELAA